MNQKKGVGSSQKSHPGNRDWKAEGFNVNMELGPVNLNLI